MMPDMMIHHQGWKMRHRDSPVACVPSTENTRIIVCCHGDCALPDDPLLFPVFGGASHCAPPVGMQRDDRLNGLPCDNISKKNQSYCELTAMYWAWRNLDKLVPNIEYIGVNHYRRYFAFGKSLTTNIPYVLPNEDVIRYRVDQHELSRYLAGFNVLTSYRWRYPYSIFQQYCIAHVGDDMRELVRVVHEVSPEYDDAMFEILFRGNVFSGCNMCVMKWVDYCEYCEWLFEVLFTVETRIEICGRNAVQSRAFGFMAERLWNVWLHAKSMRVKRLPVIQYSNSKNGSELRGVVSMLRKELGYRVSRPRKSLDLQEFHECC